jgi:hypothetical protein
MNSKNKNYESPLFNNVLNKSNNQIRHINNLEQIKNRKSLYKDDDYDPYGYLQKGKFTHDLSK